MNNFPFMPQFNQNPKQMLAELERMTNEMIRQNNQALKNLFKNEIKESFLIQVLEKIKKEHPDIANYYRNAFNMNIENILQGSDDRIDYDICCHIVGVHKSNILFLRDDEKGNLQNDNNYRQKLADKVYEHIKLRQYGSSFFRNLSFMAGDKFLFFNLGYDLFVTTMKLCEIVDTEPVKKSKMHMFYTSIILELISVLTLIENGLLMQAFPQCRNLIELYFKYEVLFDNQKEIKEYNKFTGYEIDYACNYEFPKEFLDKYDSHKEEVSIFDYLHYGWIDSIFDFNYLGKDKKYSIPGLYNYIKMKHKDNNNIDELKELHNRCHMFSHGSTISKAFPIQTYFEMMPILFYIIRAVTIDISNILKEKISDNNIDLIKLIEQDWKEFTNKSKILNIENVKKYYKMK